MQLNVIEEPVRFHFSLNVPDLDKAVDFYALFFGVEPAKKHQDYAKFDLMDPPLVFSLAPHPPGQGSTLSHLGFRVDSSETFRKIRDRLESEGVTCEHQDGTVCGYAKQNKIWIRDPFGNFWEIYQIEEEIKPELIRSSVEGKEARLDSCSRETKLPSVTWEHFITDPVPPRIPHPDDSLDEVRLTGTFNANFTEPERRFLLSEAIRVLKPGGKVTTHGLMAHLQFPGPQPKLPGLGAIVSRIPVQKEPADELASAGFKGIQITKYTEKPWFSHEGSEFREIKFIGWKPLKSVSDQTCIVIYKGPFSRVKTDSGVIFQRGVRTTISPDCALQLKLGPVAEQFLFLENQSSGSCNPG